MSYDPDKHRRRSIWLRSHDYRRAGAYFVTICAQDRQRLFGGVRESEMHLNDAGRMVERWWRELNRKFPGIETDAFNDTNAINAINANAAVGADLYIRPRRNDDDINAINANATIRPRRIDDDIDDTNAINANAAVGADLHIRPQRIDDDINDVNINDVNANADAINVGGYADPPLHVDSNADSDAGASLSQIVQWFKIMTTDEYIRGVKRSGWTPSRKHIWRRDYYEHIIRDESAALSAITRPAGLKTAEARRRGTRYD